MIALKGDPIWGELGSYDNFPDALGVDHPPFAFNSGMGWREVAAGEVRKLGITGPNGESPEDWQASRPTTMAGKLPPPQIDVNQVDPELQKKLQERDGVAVVDGVAMRKEDADAVRARSAARRAAREARSKELADQAVRKAADAYARKGATP